MCRTLIVVNAKIISKLAALLPWKCKLLTSMTFPLIANNHVAIGSQNYGGEKNYWNCKPSQHNQSGFNVWKTTERLCRKRRQEDSLNNEKKGREVEERKQDKAELRWPWFSIQIIFFIHRNVTFYMFRNYDGLLEHRNMKTNTDDDGNDSDDFMYRE